MEAQNLIACSLVISVPLTPGSVELAVDDQRYTVQKANARVTVSGELCAVGLHIQMWKYYITE